MRRRLAVGGVALSLVLGVAACGDDAAPDQQTPGTQSDLDGGKTSSTTTAGSSDMGTNGGTTSGATEGNQVPPAG
jgi:hypothetical protein